MSDSEWPHDPDGDTGSEGGRKYGMAIIAKKLDEDDFPLDRSDLLEEHGEDPIRLNHERVVSLAEIFEEVDATEFETFADLHSAVGDAMRAGGFWDYHSQ